MDPGRKVSMTHLIFAPSWWHGSSVMKRSGSKPWDLGFVAGSKKLCKKSSKQHPPPKKKKCPKSISLDSGHLDKPFGPLIFSFFQYIKKNDFSIYFSGLGTRWTPSLVSPLGRVLCYGWVWQLFVYVLERRLVIILTQARACSGYNSLSMMNVMAKLIKDSGSTPQ